MRHARLASITLTVAVLAIAACTRYVPDYLGPSGSKFGDTEFTGDQIDAEHVPNAWELLRRIVPRYTYVEDKAGRAFSIIGHRGRSSISVWSSESPIVIVDGARLASLELLQEMPTGGIDRIEVRGGSRGTTAEGTNASAGVIYIHTRSGS